MASVPSRMTAIGIVSPGGPEVLVPEERPVPAPGAGEILVKVAAAGVNRPDVMQRKGLYPPPPGAPDIPGLEIAGTVVALGEGVTRWKIGDAVCALVVGGGYAEYCLAHESHALSIPAGISLTQAAAIPETFFTVWHNVFERDVAAAGNGQRLALGVVVAQRAAGGAFAAVPNQAEEPVAKCAAVAEGEGLGAGVAGLEGCEAIGRHAHQPSRLPPA